jgi:hypothetical protein
MAIAAPLVDAASASISDKMNEAGRISVPEVARTDPERYVSGWETSIEEENASGVEFGGAAIERGLSIAPDSEH